MIKVTNALATRPIKKQKYEYVSMTIKLDGAEGYEIEKQWNKGKNVTLTKDGQLLLILRKKV